MSAATMAGRVVVVTGAASGIGLAVAEQCTAAGADVAAVDVDAAGLAALAERPRPVGHGRVVPATADVSDEGEVAAAAEVVAERLGGVDGLVTAAGIGGYTGDVVATVPAAWHRTLAVNLTGGYLVSRAVLPLMHGRAAPAVVHISSQYGLVGGAGSPAYCAAKAGVVGLTRAMAVDHAAAGVRVNCVCPGPTDTPMLRRSAGTGGAAAVAEAERTRARSLLPAPGRAADVAAAVLFLLGPGAAGTTGAVLPVDGGWTAS